MNIVETRSPLSIVHKYKLFYIDCSPECEGLDLLGYKSFVTQFEKQFNAALIEATGEDLCHDFCVWSKGWTSNFGVKRKHEKIFRETFNEFCNKFTFEPPVENKVCSSCSENYCGNCSFSDGRKIAY